MMIMMMVLGPLGRTEGERRGGWGILLPGMEICFVGDRRRGGRLGGERGRMGRGKGPGWGWE